MGEVIETKMTGSSVSEETIGGVKRNHVAEGARNVKVSVTVEWEVEELRAIYAPLDDDEKPDPVEVTVAIKSDESDAEDWLSTIDEQQDVHFPNPSTTRGIVEATLKIAVPTEPKATARDTEEVTNSGTLGRLHPRRRLRSRERGVLHRGRGE